MSEPNAESTTTEPLMGRPASAEARRTLGLFVELLKRWPEPEEVFKDGTPIPLLMPQERLLPRLMGLAWWSRTGTQMPTTCKSSYAAACMLVAYLNALLEAGGPVAERLRTREPMRWMELKLLLKRIEHAGQLLEGARLPDNDVYDPRRLGALGEALLNDGSQNGIGLSPLSFLLDAAAHNNGLN